MPQRTPSKNLPPAKAAAGGEREKRQPYATESEAYEGEAVKSPQNSDLPDAADVNSRAQDIGKPHTNR